MLNQHRYMMIHGLCEACIGSGEDHLDAALKLFARADAVAPELHLSEIERD